MTDAPLKGRGGVPHIIRVNPGGVLVEGCAEDAALQAGGVPCEHAHHHEVGDHAHAHHGPGGGWGQNFTECKLHISTEHSAAYRPK